MERIKIIFPTLKLLKEMKKGKVYGDVTSFARAATGDFLFINVTKL